MERTLAEATSARVSVKATSNEGMGWIGRGEGIACIAVASVAERIGFGSPMSKLELDRGCRAPGRLGQVFEVRVLREAGILGPMRPDKARQGRLPPSCAGAPRRRPASPPRRSTTRTRSRSIDERGSLSFERLHRRSNALAHSFAEMGIGYGDGIGIMCRNHRGFVEATLAAAKLGASALYLNTMFAGPQLVEVTRREEPKALVYDDEFAGLLEGVDDSVAPRGRLDRRGRGGVGRRRSSS